MGTLTASIIQSHSGENIEIDKMVSKLWKVEEDGNNILSSWVVFDDSTSPVKIKDNFNIKAITRVSPNEYDIIFNKEMSSNFYGTFLNAIGADGESIAVEEVDHQKKLDRLRISKKSDKPATITVQIIGGH